MHRKFSVRRGSNSTTPLITANTAPSSTTNSPHHYSRYENVKSNDDSDLNDNGDNGDIVRRESLHKPTWQHIIPGQPQPNLPNLSNITTDSNSRKNSISFTSDSDEDEYLRRPSVVVHHHYYQDKEVQQQLQLPIKPMQQLRRASLHSGVDFKSSSRSGGGTKIARHHTIASADLKIVSDNRFNLQRKGSLTHSTRTFGLMTHTDPPRLDGMMTMPGNTKTAMAAGQTPSANMDGGTFYTNAGRALMRMLSGGTNSNETVTGHINSAKIHNDGGEGYDLMGKNKVVVVDGTRVKLQIWDTAGQERFRSVTHAYYRDAHALLLLYDVTNKTTYDNIRAWLGEIREYAQDDVVIVLIGNKADCSNSERQVKREDGERLAREHNVPFMETSAKTGLNVELAFSAVARQLKCRGTVNGDDGKFNVHDFVRDNTRARTMCAQCKSM